MKSKFKVEISRTSFASVELEAASEEEAKKITVGVADALTYEKGNVEYNIIGVQKVQV